MYDLIPGTLMWRLYQHYKMAGGDPENPEKCHLAHFLVKIVIFMPFLAFFDQIFMFLLKITVFLEKIGQKWPKKRPNLTGKWVIRLR